jgi:hypothetical protein
MSVTPRLRFGLRTLLEIVTVATFILYLAYACFHRYQMQVVDSGSAVKIVILDTRTGKTWWQSVSEPGVWTSVPAPSENDGSGGF